jgi:hypothetical protein
MSEHPHVDHVFPRSFPPGRQLFAVLGLALAAALGAAAVTPLHSGPSAARLSVADSGWGD